MLIKQLQKELTLIGDDQILKLWQTDEPSMVAIQEGITKVVELLQNSDLIRLAAVGDLLKNNPELIEA